MVTGKNGRPALERKGPIKMQALDPTVWRSRCAQRMAELDPDLTRSEAERLAVDIHAFERTRAMEPEAAAEFVSIEMSRPDRAPFERRSVPRGRQAAERPPNSAHPTTRFAKSRLSDDAILMPLDRLGRPAPDQ